MGERYIDQHEAYMLIKHEAETHELPATKEAYERAALIVDQMRPEKLDIPQCSECGKWIRKGIFYVCSECGVALIDDCFEQISVFPDGYMPFCPKCSAKMEGVKNGD